MKRNMRIDTREQYDAWRAEGAEPLVNWMFDIEINLRASIQRELFGKGHSPQENEAFYRWCWKRLPHICEETMKPLPEYSAAFISHILSKGAHPEMAHDPRNINILCLEAHNRWENGDRENMRIYQRNMLMIEQLKEEYRCVSL